MSRKRKTTTDRRMEFFGALESFRAHTDKAAYLQGCRAAAPAKHDNADVRARENEAHKLAHEYERRCISIFNNVIRSLS